MNTTKYVGMYKHNDSLTEIAVGPYDSGEAFNVTYTYDNKVYNFVMYVQINTISQLENLKSLFEKRNITFVENNS